ncbi:MAG: hypothetical protein PHZ07_04290 [Patescibacteria group bacterium]|nr:hypothetical protein [Patescibacteria group bacterium]MDD4304737.1 hypothetical protein [Patescibacteria group bacterium]MDD4695508.1 hypothetical protein [Patescibacteria group bacterium]
MGSYIELNDTLQITTEQGFPKELNLEEHLKNPLDAKQFKNKVFYFHDKQGIRLFHTSPNRVFLVHNIDGKWLYWGHCLIIEQTINSETKTTSGKFIIIKIYNPEYQRYISQQEVDLGKEYLF